MNPGITSFKSIFDIVGKGFVSFKVVKWLWDDVAALFIAPLVYVYRAVLLFVAAFIIFPTTIGFTKGAVDSLEDLRGWCGSDNCTSKSPVRVASYVVLHGTTQGIWYAIRTEGTVLMWWFRGTEATRVSLDQSGMWSSNTAQVGEFELSSSRDKRVAAMRAKELEQLKKDNPAEYKRQADIDRCGLGGILCDASGNLKPEKHCLFEPYSDTYKACVADWHNYRIIDDFSKN